MNIAIEIGMGETILKGELFGLVRGQLAGGQLAGGQLAGGQLAGGQLAGDFLKE